MKHRRVVLFLIDTLSILAVCWFMLVVFPSPLDREYMRDWSLHFSLILLITLGFRLLLRNYSRVWRYAETKDYFFIVLSDTCAGLLYYLLDRFVITSHITLLRIIATFSAIALLTLVSRLVYRILYEDRKLHNAGGGNKIKIAIIGAGSVGSMLARELQRNPAAHYEPYCFIDNSETKIGRIVNGIKVLKEEPDVVEQFRKLPVQEVVLALPKLTGEEKEALYNRYSKTGCKVKIYDFPLGATGEAGERTLREFKIEDLLFRESKQFDTERVKAMYAGKVVLVTGGGGSIGSELCRQIAKLQPRQLVIFDCYENNAYDIQQELLSKHDGLNLAVEIGSVRDISRLNELFTAYRPQVVFHAAAHKHVPLMEHSCAEAVKNNVFGTYNAAEMAEKYGVERFLLVSTDKAVNPTNIMGASKRMCEMIVQSRKGTTEFMAVRFGNVLGSNGSVIPLFARQIKSGGPVTLTDKRIIRYFMTIPEAAKLLLATCAMAKSGDIYVLDMGKPVKILEMAETMIRLSGLVPYKDIDIVEIGLRPGEKLYEELLIRTENLDKTENDMIFVEHDQPLTREQVDAKLNLLQRSLSGTRQDIIQAFREVVPTYHSAETVNENAASAQEMRAAASEDAAGM